MNNSSSSNADPSSRSPVVYRLSRRGWLLVAQGTVWVALCFWFATSTCFNVGSVPRGEEIARHRADNNAPLVWMAFSLGTVLLGLLPFQVWPLLFFVWNPVKWAAVSGSRPHSPIGSPQTSEAV